MIFGLSFFDFFFKSFLIYFVFINFLSFFVFLKSKLFLVSKLCFFLYCCFIGFSMVVLIDTYLLKFVILNVMGRGFFKVFIKVFYFFFGIKLSFYNI